MPPRRIVESAKKKPRAAASSKKSARAPVGRVITFYSYKGGTGRTMALANVAWILASSGRRVLVIDWDLEAPGLHRYLHQFLDDSEGTNRPGLINFLWEFVEGARAHVDSPKTEWFASYANLGRYACSLEWEFPGDGTIDFITAGRQGSSYASSVTSFDWNEFYERLGGGTFLEAVKKNLRSEYDYVLIDSRTGISDSSGICTIQMPDDLVVCFTLNTQSIRGAAATAESAFQQRITPSRAPGLRVWPVPTRVELAERDRLERARDEVRARFQRFLHHLPAKNRVAYWGRVEVLYQPYYAYEEALAVLTDRPQQVGSLLQSFEHLTSYLTDGSVESLARGVGQTGRSAPLPPVGEDVGPFFVSYSRADEEFASRLVHALRDRLGSASVLWDQNLLAAGDPFGEKLAVAMNDAQAVLPLVGPSYVESPTTEREIAYALARGLRVIPLLLPGVTWSDLSVQREPFESLRRFYGFEFGKGLPSTKKSSDPLRVGSEGDVDQLIEFLRTASSRGRGVAVADPDDPHRGQFGGRSERNGFTLSARVASLSRSWFELELRVTRYGAPTSDTGEVEFHIHPTFDPPVRRVRGGKDGATLTLETYGAFTVGAIVLDSLSMLELDLSTLKQAPKVFREG